MLSSKEASLLAALEPRAADEGIEIVTVEVVGSRKAPTIRVYLDTPEGITFEEDHDRPGVGERDHGRARSVSGRLYA